jgi:hypothetical protein
MPVSYTKKWGGSNESILILLSSDEK